MKNRDDVLRYFGGDELATDVWYDKYRLDGEESPSDTIDRIVNEFTRVEQHFKNSLTYKQIHDYFDHFKYIIPAGSPLLGIGNNRLLTSLSNCYVIDSPVDSYAGILERDEELVQLMKRRGGVGIDISTLRPKGSIVNNAARTSTGAVSFMERYSNTTMEVAQEGRRGALIITMHVSHPDIEAFIGSKDNSNKINGANISVKITDRFMEDVINDQLHPLRFPAIDPKPGEQTEFIIDVPARRIWNKIVHQAWKSAEPGVLFWDRIISESPADCYKGFNTVSTNPCGELPLCAYDSCRLMHINMYSFVENPFTKDAKFNYEKYLQCVKDAQRLMDDMVELEGEKIDNILRKITHGDKEEKELKQREIDLWNKIKLKLHQGRRTGLNPWLGLADTLAALGMKYDSDDAINWSDEIAKMASIATYESSIQLAKERGHFPLWNIVKEKDNPFIDRILDNISKESFHDYNVYGRRNISCLTIPPAGSVAILARVSSGIEPVFNLSYKRKRRVTEDNPNKKFKDENGNWWEEYDVFHPKFKNYTEIISKSTAPANELSDSDVKAWTEESPYYKATANEINPLKKVELQGRMQRWIDHSISVTHNLPKDVSEQTISDIYFKAWEMGCKGVTVYREGSRDGVLKTSENDLKHHDAPKRPKALKGEAFHLKIKGELFTVIVGLMGNEPYEIFAYKGNGISGKGMIVKEKSGCYTFKTKNGDFNITNNLTDEQEAITRGYSWGLRHGGQVKYAVEQLNKTEGDLTSFSKAMSRVLKRYIPDGTPKDNSKCSNCGSTLVYQGGCEVCVSCGNSKCG